MNTYYLQVRTLNVNNSTEVQMRYCSSGTNKYMDMGTIAEIKEGRENSQSGERKAGNLVRHALRNVKRAWEGQTSRRKRQFLQEVNEQDNRVRETRESKVTVCARDWRQLPSRRSPRYHLRQKIRSQHISCS